MNLFPNGLIQCIKQIGEPEFPARAPEMIALPTLCSFEDRGRTQTMNDDNFNMSLRKFLKQVGVTSQQAIEAFVREEGLSEGALDAKVVVSIEGTDFHHEVNGKIELD